MPAPGGERRVLTELGAAAADCLARAVARGGLRGDGAAVCQALPDWRSKFDKQ